MILRNSFIIFAALSVSGVLNFLMISLFSRILEPAEYGVYALVMSGVSLILAFAYNWLLQSFMRFIPQKSDELTYRYMSNFLYLYLLISAGLILFVVGAYFISGPLKDFFPGFPVWIWFFLPVLVLSESAFILSSQHARLAEGLIARYALAVVARSALSIVCGYTLVVSGYGVYGILSGIALSFFLPSFFMVSFGKSWRKASYLCVDRKIIKEILAFGLPIIAVMSVQTAIGSSDKFLLTFLIDTQATGQYAVALDFVTKLLIFMMMIVHKTAYPLVVQKIEREGMEAARAQMSINVVFLMLVSVPAAMGIVMLSGPMSHLFLGEAYRDIAAEIIPYLVVVAFINCAVQFYIAPAFHFGKKTKLLIFPVVMALCINLIVSYICIPQWGIYGAIMGSFSAYAVYCILALVLSRRVFALPFPALDFMKIVAATGVMALVVYPFRAGTDVFELCLAIVLGGGVFSLCALLLNVGGFTQVILRRIRARRSL